MQINIEIWSNARYNIDSKGPFTWKKVVPDRRVTLLPEPSFTERLYEKICPCWPSQNLALLVLRMLYMSRLSLVGEAQTAKVFTVYGKNLAHPPGSPYLQCKWLSTQGHPAPEPTYVIFHVNSSLLFIKKCMKRSLAQGGSVWRVTLLPGTTFLHVNRP